MRAITFAIRVTFADGRTAFIRQGGVIGKGPIATYRTKADADAEVLRISHGVDAPDVFTVIERSHGRRV